MTESPELTIIDLSSIFWQTWHVTANEEFGEAKRRTIEKIYSYINNDAPVAIAVDWGPYKRKEIYPEYKSQRDKPSQEAVGQLGEIIDHLTNDGFPIMKSKGYEADDIIATIVARAGVPCHIVSSDKDLLQLVSPTVRATSPLMREEFGPDEVVKKFGVLPSELGELLALEGDKSDNIPGVPGVGRKTAAKIINKQPVSQSIEQKLAEYSEQIKMSRYLVTLVDDVDIDVDLCFAPRVPKVKKSNTDADTDTDTEKGSTSKPETALARVERSWALELEPRNSAGAVALSRMLCESRLYMKFQNPDAILAVMLRGRALGLDCTTALDGFHVIEGQPSLSAPLMIGLVLQSPLCDFFKCIETTPGTATYITHRSDDPDDTPQKYTYTFEQAEQAELTGFTKRGNETNWHKRPETMLRWRCATELARMVYPDIVAGLYTPDELSDGQFVEAEIVKDEK